MSRAHVLRAAVHVVVLAIGLILPAGIASLLTDAQFSAAAPLVLDSYSGPPSKRNMAYGDVVFIGRVVAAAGTVDVAEDFETSGPFFLPLYAVDVETTLKGEAAGRVYVGVWETMLADERGRQLEVGKRYLLSASRLSAAKTYAITEGFDSVEIDSDADAQALVAELEQQIARVELKHRRVLAEEKAVFIGRVVEEIGRGTTIAAQSDFPSAIRYAVAVEKTLKGGATGRVDVNVLSAGPAGEEAVSIGRRYLFAANGPLWDGTYTVEEGYDTIPIAGDQEAAMLTASFWPLIAKAEQRATKHGPVDPCAFIAAPPILDIEPRTGAAGSTIHVFASNLVASEAFLWWQGDGHGYVGFEVRPVDGYCTLRDDITVPVDLKPGRYHLFVAGAAGMTAEESFEVTGMGTPLENVLQ